MSEKTGQGSTPEELKKTTASDAGPSQAGGEELTEGELQTLAGGVANTGGGFGGIGGGKTLASDSCKETTDTGMMGCSG